MRGKKEPLVPVVVNTHQLQFGPFKEDRCHSIIKLYDEVMTNMKLSHKYARISLNKALDIGKLLTKQKEELKQGEFGPWVDNNLPFKHRTANRYMELYRNRDNLKLDDVNKISDAYKCLNMITTNTASPFVSDSDEKIKIIICPSPEEGEPIMTALNRVKQLLETNSMTRAIYALASDWLEANDDKTVLAPLEDKIRLLEKIYDVKLVVQPNA